MTFDRWKATLGPKVTGAINHHSAHAGTPLGFFLMTSSVSEILGTPGQSNYAAANSYLDAVAHHRASSGEVATSTLLPMVYVASTCRIPFSLLVLGFIRHCNDL